MFDIGWKRIMKTEKKYGINLLNYLLFLIHFLSDSLSLSVCAFHFSLYASHLSRTCLSLPLTDLIAIVWSLFYLPCSVFIAICLHRHSLSPLSLCLFCCPLSLSSFSVSFVALCLLRHPIYLPADE